MAEEVNPEQWFKTIEKTAKQTRFASILALTRVAKNAQVDVQQSLKQHFRLRNHWTRSGIRIKPALKTDRPGPYAEVFSRDWYIAQHEAGASRKVPGELQEFYILSDDFHRITGVPLTQVPPRKYRPKQVLKTKLRGNRPFRTRLRKSGKDVIAVREAKAGKPLSVLYVLEDEPVKIEARQWFGPVVERSYDKTFQKEYESALAYALRTAV